MLTSSEFVAKAKDIVDNYSTVYIMGCFGAPIVTTPFNNVYRYTHNHPYNASYNRTRIIKSVADRKPPVYGFDCVCLIKGILWGWNGEFSLYGGAEYASNGVPDIGADMMISSCDDVTSDFSSIVPGEAVWLSGHIGIYIGNNLVVECSPAWANGVQITAVGNRGGMEGYHSRVWTKHGKLPYIQYVDEPLKSVHDVAVEVIAGKWGNGEDRKNMLTEAGYDPEEVQAEVNKLLTPKKTIHEIAVEVIDGKWGNGMDRRQRLAAAGYDPDEVQAEVNHILYDKKTVHEIALEVIKGIWGNGEERRVRLADAGYDPDEVQHEVNKILGGHC